MPITAVEICLPDFLLEEMKALIGTMSSHFDLFEKLAFKTCSSPSISLNLERTSAVGQNIYMGSSAPKEEFDFVVGTQRHLQSDMQAKQIPLSKLRELGVDAEPLLRDARYVFIHPSLLRAAELNYPLVCSPAGLHVEEFCQLAKFLGMANTIGKVDLHIDDLPKDDHVWKGVFATAIWYFLEGCFIAPQDHPTQSPDFNTYIVDMDTPTEFVVNETSGRMWLKAGKQYLPCSKRDYSATAAGDMPKRLIAFLEQFL